MPSLQNNGMGVPRVPLRQIENGLPHVRLVVSAHIASPKWRADIIKHWRQIEEKQGVQISNAQIARALKRMAGEAGPADHRYPTVETTWTFAHALRAAGRKWAWPPLFYLAFGHFPAFVESMATADDARLSDERFYDLIDAIWPLMNAEECAYEPWEMTEKEGRAFLRPEIAAERFHQHQQHPRFRIAHALANDFQLGYQYQTFAVVEQLVQWANQMREPDDDEDDE